MVGEKVGHFWAIWFSSNKIPVTVTKKSRPAWYAGVKNTIDFYQLENIVG